VWMCNHAHDQMSSLACVCVCVIVYMCVCVCTYLMRRSACIHTQERDSDSINASKLVCAALLVRKFEFIHLLCAAASIDNCGLINFH